MDAEAVKDRLWGRRKAPGWLVVVAAVFLWLNNVVGIWANAEFVWGRDWGWVGTGVRYAWEPTLLVAGLLWIAFIPNSAFNPASVEVPAPSPSKTFHRDVTWRNHGLNPPGAWCPNHGTRLLYERGKQVLEPNGDSMVGRGWGALYCPSAGGHRFCADDEEPWEYGTGQREAAAILDGLVS